VRHVANGRDPRISLREMIVPLGRLSVVTGANGAGKSSLYRALRWPIAAAVR